MGDGILYLGERATPSGQRWIVAVESGGAWDDTTSKQFVFGVTTVPVSATIPAGSTLPGSAIENITILWSGYDERQEPPRAPVRFFAGQPDPADATRFTIAYEQKGRRGIVEGCLTDEKVVMTVLNGPAASIEDPVKRAAYRKRMAEYNSDFNASPAAKF